jgi:hypothetical protein
MYMPTLLLVVVRLSCVYVCVSVCFCVCLSVLICVFRYISMCSRMCVWVGVCVYVCVCLPQVPLHSWLQIDPQPISYSDVTAMLQ